MRRKSLRVQVASAALDVYSTEPPTASSQELLQHPRLVCTPHLGASTEEAQVNGRVDAAWSMGVDRAAVERALWLGCGSLVPCVTRRSLSAAGFGEGIVLLRPRDGLR